MSVRKVTGKFPTLERLAFNRIRERFPRAQENALAAPAVALGGDFRSDDPAM